MAVTVVLSGSDVTVTLSASGDTASPQNIITAGYGTLRGNKTIHLNGAYKVKLQIATGATYDDTEWVYEIPAGGSLRWNDTYGCGTWRSGYILNGSTYVKAKGHTVNYNNFDGSTGAGGRSIFYNSGIPTGFVEGTTHPTLKWNDVSWVEFGGSNAAAILFGSYIKYDCGRIVMDYSGDGAGANAGFSGSYGSIESLLIYRAIGGVGTGYNTSSVVSVGKFEYFSLPATGTEVRMAFPHNVPFYGFAPLTYQVPATNTYICANTTNTEILRDYIFPTGFDIPSRSKNYSANTRTYQRKVNISINDASGSDLTNTTVYIKSGSEILKNAVLTGDLNEYIQAVFLSWIGRSPATGSYILPISYKDTESQIAQFRKYGYFQQSVSYDVTESNYAQPIFMLTETSLSGISESTASAITTAGINWTTKTITPTANLTYDQINARIAWELAQTTGSSNVEPRTIVGSNLTLATGWSLVVNTGIVISSGTNITYMYVPTITINGTGAIQALYGNTTGNSTTLQISGFDANSSVYVEDNSAVQKYYSASATGTVTVYIPPTGTGSWYYAVEKYGNQRQSDFFTFSGGLKSIIVKALTDTGITVTNSATVGAYTSLNTPDKIYDYVAYLRLSVPHISYGQIVFKNGTALDLQDASMLVNQSAIDVASFNFSTKLLTVKSSSLGIGTTYEKIITTPPETIEANTTEVITCPIEDANGDSSLTIQGGSANFTLWKISNATAEDDYATGTNLGSVGNVTFRFLQAPGFKIVVRDNTTSFRQVVSMDKGIYTVGLFFGDQVQLAQSAEVTLINNKVDVIGVDLVTINNGVKKASKFIPHNTDI